MNRDSMLGVVLLTWLALTVPTGTATASADETAPAGPLTTWLKGPFGTVTGGSPEAPAAAAPDGAPLDAWSRGAALQLGTELPPAALTAVDLWARPVDGGGPVLPLRRHDGWFEGPDEPGRYVITAQVEADGRTGAGSWLLAVPDRDGGPAVLFEMPAIEAVLRSVTDEVLGARGHGCYVGLCQEVGRRPPPGSLAALEIGIGETPELTLGDGSALAGWQGWLEPLAHADATTRQADAAFDDEPRAVTQLDGLEPTAAGDWLLEVRADFDRERGWQWFLYRLRAE